MRGWLAAGEEARRLPLSSSAGRVVRKTKYDLMRLILLQL